MLNVEATNTNLIVFDLTQSELEPTIYRNRGEHDNHYTTDAVPIVLSGDVWRQSQRRGHYCSPDNTKKYVSEEEDNTMFSNTSLV